MSQEAVANTKPLSQLLRMAVMAGVESAVRVHIERGDNLNACDSNGQTPLMLSAARNRPAICKLLLDAGADDGVLDPSGNSALAIAIAAGANEAAAVLASVSVLKDEPDDLAIGGLEHSEDILEELGSYSAESQFALVQTDRSESFTPLPIAHAEPAPGSQETPEFDLFSWEPEEDRPPPEADASVAQSAFVIQAAIADYTPVDSSSDWGDIDAYLPERSLPLVRPGDTEASERLRLLLLRALREGSVPSQDVEALSINDDRSANPDAEIVLTAIINDLGAEVDERFEYASTDENYEVFVKAEATLDEEAIVEDAMAFIDGIKSRRSEPLRIYLRDIQRERLLSAQEEVSLGQSMELAIARALDALAAWPHGIQMTLAAGHQIVTGQRPLTWISTGNSDAEPAIDIALGCAIDENAIAVEHIGEDAGVDDESQGEVDSLPRHVVSEFSLALGRLAKLSVSTVRQGQAWGEVREALRLLQLNRRFLVELSDDRPAHDCNSASEYAGAIAMYRRAWEQMVSSNLKLVFHLAKKYQYSGEPLDDLVQEGNLGLFKAIERFDWRRGFKFSTYATWWIRQQITRYIADKCRTVRLPVHVHEKVQRVSREIRKFESETGLEPNLGAIAARLGMPMHKVVELKRLESDALPFDDFQIDEAIAVEAKEDFTSPDPLECACKVQLAQVINELLSTLKPKEERILRMRLGLGIGDQLTLDEIGIRYEVTRERVRQIEAAAIRKLKHPIRRDPLSLVVFGNALACQETVETETSPPAGNAQEAE